MDPVNAKHKNDRGAQSLNRAMAPQVDEGASA